MNIVFIAAGSAACHRRVPGAAVRLPLVRVLTLQHHTVPRARSVAIDDAGRVYTWGRNEARTRVAAPQPQRASAA